MSLTLVACQKHEDLYAFFEAEKLKTPPKVDPLPEFKSFPGFSYKAAGQRSPFQPFLRMRPGEGGLAANVAPDENRPKEHLETYALENLAMVGSLQDERGLYALINAPDAVHRVTVGNYMGKNHGRVTEITTGGLRVVEIVSAGAGAWVERPRVLELKRAGR
jgi:type IV pilus assembly protein PilP